MQKYIDQISKALFDLRVENGYSLKCLANVLNVTVPTYCDFELGNKTPDALQMLTLVRFYGVTLDTVYGIQNKTIA